MKAFRHFAGQAAIRVTLVLAIMLQATLAASAMARMDAKATAAGQIIICTPEGPKSIVWPSNGPDQGGEPHTDCECPCGALCSAFAGSVLPGSGTGFIGMPELTGMDAHRPPTETPHMPVRKAGTGTGPRAPPVVT